jgi:hypothetical protein
MTAAERATQLVNDWLEDAQGLPIPVSVNRLGLAVAEALDTAEHDAYIRGLRDVAEFLDQEPRNQIQALVNLAAMAGAQGIWLVRGIENPDLIYNLPGEGLNLSLSLADASVILIARLPDDGGEAGIEFHSGNGS